MLFTGCSSSNKQDGINQKETITVWSHLTQAELKQIRPIADEWANQNNVNVRILEDKSDMQSYSQFSEEGKAPDIMFGVTHDNLGDFYKNGCLDTVPLNLINKSDYVSNALFDATSIDGKQVAIPLAQESIALYYNKDLVKTVPTTMEQLVSDAKKVGFKFNIHDFYLDYGFIAANGGYIFGQDNGRVNPLDIGLGTAGAIKGYEFIDSLVKNGLISKNINDDIAKQEFIDGKSAYYISGPWNISTFNSSGVNFGVAPIPTLNGNAVTPFLGVQVAFVSAQSEHKELSWDLVKYLCENTGEILVTQGNRVPVLNSIINSDLVKNTEHLSDFINQSKNAVPMPNIPELQYMWQHAPNYINQLTAGAISPEEAAKNTANSILKSVKKQTN